jgi:hypothetical protein
MAGNNENITEESIVVATLSQTAKRFEPEPRNHDGYRHHSHRFEIVGGISLGEVLKRQLLKRSPVLARLRDRS